LPQQLHAMHLRLGAASAVIAGPFSPDGATGYFAAFRRAVAPPGQLADWDDEPSGSSRVDR
ncbi:MAG: hypothetical protein ACLFRU_01705, partial [Paracoccaceae bacterium]